MEPSGSKAARPAIKSRVTVLVVERAFLRVAQDVIGLAQLLELLLGGFVSRVLIRMMFDRERPVGLLDVVRPRAALNAEHLVAITFGHGLANGLLGHDDAGGTQKPVAQLISFAMLVHDLAFGHFRRFLLRERFVEIRVKRLA